MVPVPRIRGAICATAHPVWCAVRVDGEIRAALEHDGLARARRGVRALVVGASRGYGLSARIALAFGCGA
ncbi:MAG: bifunctional NADH-specific enoyl-ACP reductase/trans-2-enoyl-CoA reductase, partial [Fibrobacterales bacterium]|nr:bifunctional NADH-specific enoyl-ACP reductase/trans-2-enoyl-CoA reductase [Fibrobacterales bacterium]